VAAVTRNPEKEGANAIIGGLAGGLERYGVKLRPISLTVVGPMMVQMMGFKPSFPEAYQMTAMLFVLGAPLKRVYQALEVGEREGCASFMALAAGWIAETGIPQDMSTEVTQAITETFAMANKLIGGGGDTEKKA
jgi:hypothetical protein